MGSSLGRAGLDLDSDSDSDVGAGGESVVGRIVGSANLTVCLFDVVVVISGWDEVVVVIVSCIDSLNGLSKSSFGSSILLLLSNLSIKELLNPESNSFRSCWISSRDISCILWAFSSSILFISDSSNFTVFLAADGIPPLFPYFSCLNLDVPFRILGCGNPFGVDLNLGGEGAAMLSLSFSRISLMNGSTDKLD